MRGGVLEGVREKPTVNSLQLTAPWILDGVAESKRREREWKSEDLRNRV
jgi:hypothetical protein